MAFGQGRKAFVLSDRRRSFVRCWLSLVDNSHVRQPPMIFSLKWFWLNFIGHVFYRFPQKRFWKEKISIKKSDFLDLLSIILSKAPAFFLFLSPRDVKFDEDSESRIYFCLINGMKDRKCRKTDFHIFVFVIAFLNRTGEQYIYSFINR